MYIQYLREFIEVTRCLNYSRAAANLITTQSTLSKHIAALEEECECSLFKRNSSRVRLTVEGEALLEEALVLVRTHDNALERIRSLREAPRLIIGGLYKNSLVLQRINKTLATLKDEGTPIFLSYQDYRHHPYLDLVKEDTVDMAITILTDEDDIGDELVNLLLFDDPMVAVVKRDHPFASQQSIHLADIDGKVILEPIGSYSSDCGQGTVQYLFTKYQTNPKKQPVFVRSIFDLSTVDSGDLILIMEQSLFRTQPFTDDYVVVPFVEEDAVFSFHVLYRKDNDKPGLCSFVKHLIASGE